MLASADGELAVIYGAGLAGAGAARQMLANPGAHLRPVGFIDDNPEKVGRSVNGYPILGTIGDLGDVVRRLGATVVVVSSTKIPHDRVAEAQEASVAAGARLLRMRIDFVEASPEYERHALPSATEAGDAPEAPPAGVTSRVGI
jgi:FlaA1/EpsC-like NDP-sugar epimerase